MASYKLCSCGSCKKRKARNYIVRWRDKAGKQKSTHAKTSALAKELIAEIERDLTIGRDNKDITLLASSPETKYQIFKYQNHAYGIQFHIEVKETTVNEWGCVPEYKSALEKELGPDALQKFDSEAQANMDNMNNYSKILYSKFKSDILKI